VNSRIHVVEEFNRNVYDVIIASDEHEVLGDEDTIAASEQTPASEDKQTSLSNEDGAKRAKKRQRQSKRDKEYGVSRGIDFKNVACVVNFDLPTSSKSYTHRIGRTARAGQNGMAISFVIPSEHYRKHMPTTIESTENDEKTLTKIVKQQAKKGKEVKPYNFDMKQVEAFRYRMNDALRAVTKVAIREARTRELRQELLKSEKLKRHFEENPAELHHLRHDGELRAARTQAHLRHVPEYLLPKEGKDGLSTEQVGFVPLRKTSDRKKGKFKGQRKGKFRVTKRKSDPLRSFKARSKKK
jgi:ATP-dependent RNA helicase DDX56/DBP9